MKIHIFVYMHCARKVAYKTRIKIDNENPEDQQEDPHLPRGLGNTHGPAIEFVSVHLHGLFSSSFGL